jgi:mycothiol synthase
MKKSERIHLSYGMEKKSKAYQSLCFVKSEEYINVYSYGTVHYRYRRQGIGSEILDHSLKHLKERAKSENKKIIYYQMVTNPYPGQNELAQKFSLKKNTDLLSFKYTGLNIQKNIHLPEGFSFVVPTIKDASEWATIYNEAFSWRINKDNTTTENVVFEFSSFEFSPVFYILCPMKKESQSAFSSSRLEDHHGAVISTLAVRPQFQGLGIGKALLHEEMVRMKENNVKHIRLTVDANNPSSAIKLYKNSGFQMDKRLIQYVYEINPIR